MILIIPELTLTFVIVLSLNQIIDPDLSTKILVVASLIIFYGALRIYNVDNKSPRDFE